MNFYRNSNEWLSLTNGINQNVNFFSMFLWTDFHFLYFLAFTKKQVTINSLLRILLKDWFYWKVKLMGKKSRNVCLEKDIPHYFWTPGINSRSCLARKSKSIEELKMKLHSLLKRDILLKKHNLLELQLNQAKLAETYFQLPTNRIQTDQAPQENTAFPQMKMPTKWYWTNSMQGQTAPLLFFQLVTQTHGLFQQKPHMICQIIWCNRIHRSYKMSQALDVVI